MIGLYVDDFVLAGCIIFLTEVKRIISLAFDAKDLGPAKYIIGLQITQMPEGIFVNQFMYITKVLAEIGLLNAHPVACLMTEANVKGIADSTPADGDVSTIYTKTWLAD